MTAQALRQAKGIGRRYGSFVHQVIGSAEAVAYPGIFFARRDSTNSVEDRRQRTGIWGR